MKEKVRIVVSLTANELVKPISKGYIVDACVFATESGVMTKFEGGKAIV